MTVLRLEIRSEIQVLPKKTLVYIADCIHSACATSVIKIKIWIRGLMFCSLSSFQHILTTKLDFNDCASSAAGQSELGNREFAL